MIARKGYPNRWIEPRQLSVGRSKALGEINEAMLVDVKQQMENFAVEYDADLMRIMILEDIMLDGDDRHQQESEGGPDPKSDYDSDSDSEYEIDAQPPSSTVSCLGVHA
jgi:hypothetical protein